MGFKSKKSIAGKKNAMKRKAIQQAKKALQDHLTPHLAGPQQFASHHNILPSQIVPTQEIYVRPIPSLGIPPLGPSTILPSHSLIQAPPSIPVLLPKNFRVLREIQSHGGGCALVPPPPPPPPPSLPPPPLPPSIASAFEKLARSLKVRQPTELVQTYPQPSDPHAFLRGPQEVTAADARPPATFRPTPMVPDRDGLILHLESSPDLPRKN